MTFDIFQWDVEAILLLKYNEYDAERNYLQHHISIFMSVFMMIRCIAL